MSIWFFLFFFGIGIGLVMLFVIGTKGGISQQISSEDACDPYDDAKFTSSSSDKLVVARKSTHEEEIDELVAWSDESVAIYADINGDHCTAASFRSI